MISIGRWNEISLNICVDEKYLLWSIELDGEEACSLFHRITKVRSCVSVERVHIDGNVSRERCRNGICEQRESTVE